MTEQEIEKATSGMEVYRNTTIRALKYTSRTTPYGWAVLTPAGYKFGFQVYKTPELALAAGKEAVDRWIAYGWFTHPSLLQRYYGRGL